MKCLAIQVYNDFHDPRKLPYIHVHQDSRGYQKVRPFMWYNSTNFPIKYSNEFIKNWVTDRQFLIHCVVCWCLSRVREVSRKQTHWLAQACHRAINSPHHTNFLLIHLSTSFVMQSDFGWKSVGHLSNCIQRYPGVACCFLMEGICWSNLVI